MLQPCGVQHKLSAEFIVWLMQLAWGYNFHHQIKHLFTVLYCITNSAAVAIFAVSGLQSHSYTEILSLLYKYTLALLHRLSQLQRLWRGLPQVPWALGPSRWKLIQPWPLLWTVWEPSPTQEREVMPVLTFQSLFSLSPFSIYSKHENSSIEKQQLHGGEMFTDSLRVVAHYMTKNCNR